MKAVALTLTLIFLGSFSYAQTQKVTVYCQVYPTLGGLQIDYNDLDKFLPDSLKTTVLKNYKKQYHLRNADVNNLILLLNTDGWQLVSTYYRESLGTNFYILSKDILLDEAAHQLYIQKLKSSFKPN